MSHVVNKTISVCVHISYLPEEFVQCKRYGMEGEMVQPSEVKLFETTVAGWNKDTYLKMTSEVCAV